jgi:hypothetical protein
MFTEIRIPPVVEEEAIFQSINGLGKKNMVMGPDGARNQE